MAGLQGSGKTTATAKLARMLKEDNDSGRHRRVRRLPPGRDRPALKVGGQVGATVYEQGTDANPVKIAHWALDQAKQDGKDVLIVDTAGRLHVDER